MINGLNIKFQGQSVHVHEHLLELVQMLQVYYKSEQMIKKNIRVNNEFYVCPVFNEAIKDKKTIKIHNVDSMWGLGTPEDLKYFIENYK